MTAPYFIGLCIIITIAGQVAAFAFVGLLVIYLPHYAFGCRLFAV